MVRLLALGVICSEKNVNWRQRLRAYYSLRASADLLVRYILDDKYVSVLRAQGKLVGDEVCCSTHFVQSCVSSPPNHPPCLQLGVYVSAPPSGAHCVEKAFGWWRAALQFPAQFYAKADDDTVLSPVHVVVLLSLLPRRAVYAGAGQRLRHKTLARSIQ